MSWDHIVENWILIIGIILIFLLIHHEISSLKEKMNGLEDKVYGCWEELGVLQEEHDDLKTALIEKQIISDDDDDEEDKPLKG